MWPFLDLHLFAFIVCSSVNAVDTFNMTGSTAVHKIRTLYDQKCHMTFMNDGGQVLVTKRILSWTEVLGLREEDLDHRIWDNLKLSITENAF